MAYSIQVKDKKNKEARLRINKDQLIIESNQTEETIELEYIYGVTIEPNSTFKIHVALSSGNSEGRRVETEWKQRILEYKSEEDITQFIDLLKERCLPLDNETRIIALINPFSGRRAAAELWETVVRPMLVTSGFGNLTTITTTSGGKTRQQTRQLVAEEDWEKAILLILGGDGTVHEVINGLIDTQPTTAFRVGVIPTGSGNAFSMGLGIDSVMHATLRVIKGQTKPCSWMDVRLGHSDRDNDWQDHVVCDEVASRLLVIMSWGFHAQIVSKSRYLRYFMGNARFTLVATVLLAFLQQYPGELVLKNVIQYKPNEDHTFGTERSDTLVIKEDQFTYFIVSKQPSLEKGFEIAPFASPLDSDLDVILLRQANSKQLTEASVKAFQGGNHVDLPFVEYYKTNELYLRVKHKAELCLDGEIHNLPPNGIVHLKAMGSNDPSFVVFV